jgi:predicted membrane channel-forming protein YqfA (hemolysin III family)
MKTTFTTEQFFNVFEKYNVTLFPVQWALLLLAILALFLFYSRSASKNKIISVFLGWIWMGLVYHIIFLTLVNKWAFVFGGFFIFARRVDFNKYFIKRQADFKFIFPNKRLWIVLFYLIWTNYLSTNKLFYSGFF